MKYKTSKEYWLNKEFNELYRDINDPWGCQQCCDSLYNRIFLEIIFDSKKYQQILDIGCGLGGFTDALYRRNGSAPGSVVGVDVSTIAIEKATAMYEEIQFNNINIISDEIDFGHYYDIVICNEILWYILDTLPNIYNKIEALLTPQGLIAIKQYFPYDQSVGVDIIKGISGFMDFIKIKTDLIVVKQFIINESDGQVLIAILQKEV